MKPTNPSQTQTGPARITFNVGGAQPVQSAHPQQVQLRVGGQSSASINPSGGIQLQMQRSLSSNTQLSIHDLTEAEIKLLPRKGSLVVVRETEGEEDVFILHQVSKVTESGCRLRDIEDGRTVSVPWKQIFLIKTDDLVAGDECAALYYDEGPGAWTTSYYRARIFPRTVVQHRTSKETSGPFTVVFSSELRDSAARGMGEPETIYRTGRNLDSAARVLCGIDNVPTIIKLVPSERYAAISLALRKQSKATQAATISAANMKSPAVDTDATAVAGTLAGVDFEDTTKPESGGVGSSTIAAESGEIGTAPGPPQLSLATKLRLVVQSLNAGTGGEVEGEAKTTKDGRLVSTKAGKVTRIRRDIDHAGEENEENEGGKLKVGVDGQLGDESSLAEGDWEDVWEIDSILAASATAPGAGAFPATSSVFAKRNLSALSSIAAEGAEGVAGGQRAIALAVERNTKLAQQYLALEGDFSETSSMQEFFGADDIPKDMPSYPPPPEKIVPGAPPILFMHPFVPMPTLGTLGAASRATEEHATTLSKLPQHVLPWTHVPYSIPFEELSLPSRTFLPKPLPYAASKGLWGNISSANPQVDIKTVKKAITRVMPLVETVRKRPRFHDEVQVSSNKIDLTPEEKKKMEEYTRQKIEEDFKKKMLRTASGIWVPKGTNVILKNQGVVVAPFTLPF